MSRAKKTDLKVYLSILIIGVLAVVVNLTGLDRLVVDLLTPDPLTPNVVLLLLDTVRADHVGATTTHHSNSYGAGGLTPYLDSLAAHGIAYPNCQAQSTWTLPAMASIFTGVSERAHMVNTGPDHMKGISEEYETIVELAHDAGYETYGLFNVPVMDAPYGFHQGYDHINANGCSLAVDAEYVVNQGLEWLDERENEDGFFMTLHFFDAHYPYDPPDEYWDFFRDVDRFEFPLAAVIETAYEDSTLNSDDMNLLHLLYCGEIMSMDAEIGRFLEELRVRGLYEETIIIAVADHGEEFGEHGMLFHGNQLYDETIHVPLIMSGPGIGENLTIGNPVGQYDILPTLMHLLGLDTPEYVEGSIMLPEYAAHAYIPSSGDKTGEMELVAVRIGNGKLIWGPDQQEVGFDLSEDPEEQSPMYADNFFVAKAMEYWATPITFDPIVVPNSEQRSALLRDLGYIR